MLTILASTTKAAVTLARNPVIRRVALTVAAEVAASVAVVMATDAVRAVKDRKAVKDEGEVPDSRTFAEKVADVKNYTVGATVEAMGTNVGVYVVAPAVVVTTMVAAATSVFSTPMELTGDITDLKLSGGWQRKLVRFMSRTMVVPAHQLGDRLQSLGRDMKTRRRDEANILLLIKAIVDDPIKTAERLSVRYDRSEAGLTDAMDVLELLAAACVQEQADPEKVEAFVAHFKQLLLTSTQNPS